MKIRSFISKISLVTINFFNPYPRRLLPRKSYKFIDSNQLLNDDFYLLRTDLREVQKKDIIDFSVNLLGRFTRTDVRFQIKDEHKKRYHASWNEGDSPHRPRKNHFEIKMRLNVYWYKFNQIHGYPFYGEHIQQNIMYHYFCNLRHRPTLSNFWHFVLDWFDEHGNIITVEKGKVRGIPKYILGLMNAQFYEHKLESSPKSIRKLEWAVFDNRNFIRRLISF